MSSQTLQLSNIRTDAGTQVRCVITTDIVDEYAERMQEGDKFPPVDVFFDKQLGEFYLADGFHRVAACLKNDFKDVLATVHDGDALAALEFALAANRANGLRRTNADKHHAVVMALQKFSDRSDRKIASLIGVSHPFVANVRSQLETVTSSTERKGADNKVRTVKPKKAKKQPTPEICESAKAPSPKPEPVPVPVPVTAPEPAKEETNPFEQPFDGISDSPALIALKEAWKTASEEDRIEFVRWMKHEEMAVML